ncbi:hypothetical protein ACHAL6_07925 [Proteiniclasticum sp. C24MP]|uniref:hypothetical protein n=1 Tax=Proteiniclasticum sp. C24MP TaxID=3374101 RepID=UPI003753FA2D
MSYRKKNESGSHGGNLDYILDDYKRNEKKVMENSCVTGSDSGKTDDGSFRMQKIMKLISVLSTFSLVLGFLVFLALRFF